MFFKKQNEKREPLFKDLGDGRTSMVRVMDRNDPKDVEEFDNFMQDKTKTLVL